MLFQEDRVAYWRMTRRDLLQTGATAAAFGAPARGAASDPRLREAIAKLEYLTPLERDVVVLDKGKAGVAKLPPERLREIGLVPETWRLEVTADPASDSIVEQPLSRALGNALDWSGLMRMAEKHAVRFLHPTTCTNGPDPFHVRVWEGVPLREIIWLVKPKGNIRRVYYQSYHNEGTAPFQGSLPLGQILEEPPGQLPVLLAYRMNGQVIPASLGGPVRMVVPGAYGSRWIKWVQRVFLTNDYKCNDSDAELNNDTESAMKTRARFVNPPSEVAAGKPAPITGWAQVGISGLAKVQFAVHSQKEKWPEDDPFWSRAEWKEASILPPPLNWGGGLPGGRLPAGTRRFDPAKGTPDQWPMRFTIVHWAALIPPLAPGSYDVCCRTIDGNGIAQPMPRPFLRTGFNAIHRLTVVAK